MVNGKGQLHLQHTRGKTRLNDLLRDARWSAPRELQQRLPPRKKLSAQRCCRRKMGQSASSGRGAEGREARRSRLASPGKGNAGSAPAPPPPRQAPGAAYIPRRYCVPGR